MKKTRFISILFAALLSVCSCVHDGGEVTGIPVAENPAPKVPINFSITLPNDGPKTKAMGYDPEVRNVVVVVFGDSGYFNEWVPAEATTEMASENGTTYNLAVKLTMSASRLRLHVIANCPSDILNNPPITGVSTQDTEEQIMSKILSHIGNEYTITDSETSTSTTYNIEDGYWQKIYLPYGVEAEVEENGNGEVVYKTDEFGNIQPTQLTLDQFRWISPIPLVRNFCRVKLIFSPSVEAGWDITHIGLVNAPKDGTIAPILSSPYKVDIWGSRLNVTYTGVTDDSDGTAVAYPVANDNVALDSDETGLHRQGHELLNTDGTDQLLSTQVGTFYDELFVTNYQNLPLETTNRWRLLTDAPYNYEGTSPIPMTFAPNPATEADLMTVPKTSLGAIDVANMDFLYLYERPKPRVLDGKAESPTRIIIRAKQKGVEGAKYQYFPLDIVDDEGNNIALLRNHTYYVSLTGIDKDAGKDKISDAITSSGSNVSDDPATQDLNEVSDGISSLAVEYIDRTLTESGTYDLYYRFFPVASSQEQDNASVTIQVGYAGTTAGFQPGTIGSSPVFAGTAANPSVAIDKTGSSPTLWVRSGNGWTEATTDVEKKTAWSKITFTTKDGESGTKFLSATNSTIRVIGTNSENHKSLHRDVLINLSPILDMEVECAQKYIQRGLSVSEDLIIRLPVGLTRSMFPLELKIEVSEKSLTPRDGDNLPAKSGASIIDGKSSFYYIRTVSRQEYEGITAQGDWKPITCKFKTTKQDSASQVYVDNEYFNIAHDSFLNYDKRLFDDLAFSNFRQEGDAAYVTFSYRVDNAHSTGTRVWDNNDNGELTTAQRVMPRYVSFEFTNLSPITTSNTLIQTGFTRKGSSNVYYLYEVPDNNAATYAPSFSFRVVDPSKNFGVKIHTRDLPYDSAQPDFVPNPDLFDEASLSYTSVVAVTGVSISPTSLSMGRGQTQNITANCTPTNATFGYVKWTSSDESVATVDAAGNVTAVGIGTAIITAEALPAGSGIKASCVVTVADNPLTSVSLPATQSVTVGNTVTLTPTYNPANASIQTRTWSSSNTAVATVDENGVVTGKASGTANITLTVTDYNGNTRTSNNCVVTVKRWVTGTYTFAVNNSNYANNNRSFTDSGSGITITLNNNCTGGNNGTNYYKIIGGTSNNSNGTITISSASSSLEGCKLQGAVITYYTQAGTTYNSRDVTSNPGTISNNKTTWTASSTGENRGDSSTVITMARGYNAAGYYPNRITQIVITYGYYD